MCTYLIDYENLNGEKLAKLGPVEKDDKVIVFYSTAGPKPGSRDDVKRFVGEDGGEFTCEKVITGTKNALDFQLSVKLGLLAKEKKSPQPFHIVSDDKGFDCVVGYMTRQGLNVDRVGTRRKKKSKQKTGLTQKPQIEQKPVSELVELLAKEDKPEEVCGILKAHSDGKAVCEALDKLYRDNKHTSKVYKKIKPFIGELGGKMGRVIWDAKMIEVEDLPTLSAALQAADTELLTDEVLRLCPPPKGSSKKQRAKTRRKVVKAIEEMRGIEPACPEPAEEKILFPMHVCEYAGGRFAGKFKLKMQAELVAISEMWRAGAELGGLADEKDDGRPVRLSCYAYEWVPWKEVLGYRVWMGGFADARNGELDDAALNPGDKGLLPRLARPSHLQVLSRRERYQFLAAVVGNMTVCGWSEKRQRRNVGEFAARLAEAREEPVYEGYPVEVALARFGGVDAKGVGLEASTDDYADEYERIMGARACAVQSWIHLDFLNCVDDLYNMLERGYGRVEGVGADE